MPTTSGTSKRQVWNGKTSSIRKVLLPLVKASFTVSDKELVGEQKYSLIS